MQDKKQNIIKSPDLSTLQEVVIDFRTTIYIPKGASVEEAKSRYHSRLGAFNKNYVSSRKPATAEKKAV